jgi:F0F1-type ATP synthase assembly protein I
MASQEPSPNKKSSQYNTYLKYSGLAFQLLAAIGVLGWLGYLLDKRLNSIPLFTLLFGFLAFGGMMYQIYRSINK